MKLTQREKQIILDTEFLKTKIAVINKIEKLFEEIRIVLENSIVNSGFNFPDVVDLKYGKVFRGENYRSLPYVTLDYPKLFSNNDTFTFRTMFWWGNFFSSTLHLQGESLNKYRGKLLRNYNAFLTGDVYICVNNTPWEYHYEKNNYVELTESNIDLLSKKEFIKISQKYYLKDYEKLPLLTNNFFNTILKVLSD